jgi:hypothetical protein
VDHGHLASLNDHRELPTVVLNEFAVFEMHHLLHLERPDIGTVLIGCHQSGHYAAGMKARSPSSRDTADQPHGGGADDDPPLAAGQSARCVANRKSIAQRGRSRNSPVVVCVPDARAERDFRPCLPHPGWGRISVEVMSDDVV